MYRLLRVPLAALAALVSLWAPAILAQSARNATRHTGTDSLRVPILVYHSVMPHHPGQTRAQRVLDVDDSVFAQQMRYLADSGYHVVPFAALVDALEGHGTLPRRAVVLTFDDGWKNRYRHALPILERFGYTATFFVFTTPIGTDDKVMTWDELRALQAAGMTIGSHTRTHPSLPRYHAALHNEVAMSREDIAQHLGKAPDFFAYPFGDWDAASEAWARKAGYRAARAYRGGAWNAPSDLYHLHAIPVTDNMKRFIRAVSGSQWHASGPSAPREATNARLALRTIHDHPASAWTVHPYGRRGWLVAGSMRLRDSSNTRGRCRIQRSLRCSFSEVRRCPSFRRCFESSASDARMLAR